MTAKKASTAPKKAQKEKKPAATTKTAAKTAPKTAAQAEPAVAALTHNATTPPATQAKPPTPAVKIHTPPAVQGAATAVFGTTIAPLDRMGSMPGAGNNAYCPFVATVTELIDETHNIKTLRVVLDDIGAMRAFSFGAGQVGQLSVFGVGEATFVINSPPSQKDYLQFSVMKAGEVTEAIHKLSAGDKIGVRGPLGQPFPAQAWKGKDIFFIGGGIGMAPVRTIMLHVLENKKDYGKVSLLYGARSPRDMAYNYELDSWMRNPDLDCTLTIDAPFEGWGHKVGLIPHVLLDIAPKPENSVAVLCGPPIMIKFTVEALKKLNFADENIVTTLEKRMKCGIGICGRCNIGHKYVCVDGPVFTWAELKDLPPEL